jgi:hypothetical protein
MNEHETVKQAVKLANELLNCKVTVTGENGIFSYKYIFNFRKDDYRFVMLLKFDEVSFFCGHPRKIANIITREFINNYFKRS